jgi:hypothetical protein
MASYFLIFVILSSMFQSAPIWAQLLVDSSIVFLGSALRSRTLRKRFTTGRHRNPIKMQVAPVDPDLIKVTEIFLVPSSFLVAALAAADTNPHRAGVSLLGFAVSVLWLICSLEALPGADSVAPLPTRSMRRRILGWLPFVFVVGWLASTVIHFLLGRQPIHA